MKEILILKRSKLFSWLLGKGILFSMLFVFFIYMAMNILSPRKVIKYFNYQHFVISSSSMDPVLKVGDIVFVKSFDPEKLEKNDIISFYHEINYDGEQKVITHFFDSTQEKNSRTIYRTKRAGTNELDSWLIEEEDLIGKYAFHFKGLGKIILFFNHPLGLRIFLIDIVIIYLIILLTKDID